MHQMKKEASKFDNSVLIPSAKTFSSVKKGISRENTKLQIKSTIDDETFEVVKMECLVKSLLDIPNLTDSQLTNGDESMFKSDEDDSVHEILDVQHLPPLCNIYLNEKNQSLPACDIPDLTDTEDTCDEDSDSEEDTVYEILDDQYLPALRDIYINKENQSLPACDILYLTDTEDDCFDEDSDSEEDTVHESNKQILHDMEEKKCIRVQTGKECFIQKIDGLEGKNQ